MTMLSFRTSNEEVAEADRWADRFGVSRSELLREALHRYLVGLASEFDADFWLATPLSPGELALGEIADWGPSEDWSDWADETR